MIGNVVLSEVDALMYVVLSKAEKTCLMGNWLVPLNVGHFNRVKSISEIV